MKKLALLLCFFAVAFPVFSQNIIFNRLLNLGTGMIRSVAQDKQGFLWLGVRNGKAGLYKYDGNVSIPFTNEPGNNNSLIDNNVRQIAIDKSGIIWIGTSGGLDRFDPITETFTHFTHNPEDSTSLSNDSILTAGIAHKIQNPLNFINNFAEINKELIEEMKDELNKNNIESAKILAFDIGSNQEEIQHHGKRADGIVKSMLQHSRTNTAVKEYVDINKLADEHLKLSFHGMRAKEKSFNAAMKIDFEEGLPLVMAVSQEIGRVILNLLTNAFYAINEKRKMNIPGYEPMVSIQTKKSADNIEIRIEDNGNGIPENVMDKIFQPFFTTKPTGQGTGLGLSMSYDIITKGHNGQLLVESHEGSGTIFTIILPSINITA